MAQKINLSGGVGCAFIPYSCSGNIKGTFSLLSFCDGKRYLVNGKHCKVGKKIACTDVISQYSFKDPLICSSSNNKQVNSHSSLLSCIDTYVTGTTRQPGAHLFLKRSSMECRRTST